MDPPIFPGFAVLETAEEGGVLGDSQGAKLEGVGQGLAMILGPPALADFSLFSPSISVLGFTSRSRSVGIKEGNLKMPEAENEKDRD